MINYTTPNNFPITLDGRPYGTRVYFQFSMDRWAYAVTSEDYGDCIKSDHLIYDLITNEWRNDLVPHDSSPYRGFSPEQVWEFCNESGTAP